MCATGRGRGSFLSKTVANVARTALALLFVAYNVRGPILYPTKKPHVSKFCCSGVVDHDVVTIRLLRFVRFLPPSRKNEVAARKVPQERRVIPYFWWNSSLITLIGPMWRIHV